MAVTNHYFPLRTRLNSVQENQWVRQGKLLTELVLPFISLYRPAKTPLSYGLGVLSIAQHMEGIVWGTSEKRMQNALEVAKGVAELATTYFQYRAALIGTSTLELVQSLHDLYQAPPQDKIPHVVKCLSISIQLLVVVQQNSLQWIIVSLILQAVSHFYQAYQTYYTEKKPENYSYEKPLIIVTKIAMGSIRFYQASQVYSLLQFQKRMQQLLDDLAKLEEDESPAPDQPIEEAPEQTSTQNAPVEESTSSREEVSLAPSKPVEKEAEPTLSPKAPLEESTSSREEVSLAPSKPIEKEAEPTLSPNAPLEESTHSREEVSPAPSQPKEPEQTLSQIWENETNHPLRNFSEQIEARRVILIDPTTGQKYDLGAYFHGFGGKGLVKGANLQVQRKISENGSVMMELSFKVNQFYVSQLQPDQEVVKLTPAKVKVLHSTLKGSAEITPSASLRDLVSVKSGDTLELSGEFHCSKDGALLFHFKQEELSINLKTLLSPGYPRTSSVKLKGVGSLKVGKARGEREANTVRVSLAGDQDIGAFHHFLSLFGLEEAIKPSTPDDIEKIKLGFLFKLFYPHEAYRLQKDETFLTLSAEEMKQKMISMVPPMENYLKEYTVEPVEVLPGYVRYSTRIDKKIYDLGARALTAIITRTDEEMEEEIPTELNSEALAQIANMVKNGMFSKRMKNKGGMIKSGLGGNGAGGSENVYTQMIWKEEVGQKKVEKLGYADAGIIRLYFSLKSLNRGSYQFNRDLGGTKESAYEKRKNIFNFITDFPFWKKAAIKEHEVMIPDRILPEEIQGISIPTEKMQQQILEHFRKHQLVQVDDQGNETINNIPVSEFLSTDHKIPSQIIKRCGVAEAEKV